MASGSDDVSDDVKKRVICSDYTVHGEILKGKILVNLANGIVNSLNFNLTKICL